MLLISVYNLVVGIVGIFNYIEMGPLGFVSKTTAALDIVLHSSESSLISPAHTLTRTFFVLFCYRRSVFPFIFFIISQF